MSDSKTLLGDIEALTNATLRSPGRTSVRLRQAVESRAASLSGGVRRRLEVPEVVRRFVDKVALHAYRVEDDDIRRLREAGLSEDEIFEITLSAALGAGLARLERGMAALETRRMDAAGDTGTWALP